MGDTEGRWTDTQTNLLTQITQTRDPRIHRAQKSNALLLFSLLFLVVLPLVSDLLDVLLEGDFELGKFLLGLLLRLSDRLLKLLDLFLVLPC